MSTDSMFSSRVHGLTAALLALGAASCASTRDVPPPADLTWLDGAGAFDLGGSALVIHSAGLGELLSDPRDAGLLRALALLDERLLELPGEFGGNAPPPGAIEFLCEALAAPWTLRVDLDGDGPIPIRAEWVVRPGSSERASALAARFAGLLVLIPFAPGGVENRPGLSEVAWPVGSLFHGTSEDGSAFVLAWGEPRGRALDLALAGLPEGTRPGLALGFDFAALMTTVRRMVPADDPEAAEFANVLALLGLEGNSPLRLTLASGSDDEGAHFVSRYAGWVPVVQRTGGLATGPIPPAAMDLVPRDATLVSISRSELGAVLSVLEKLGGEQAELLGMVRDQIGIDIGADLLEPLGQTFGFYMSESTGGGDLASSVLFVAVDDEQRLRATLDTLAARLNVLGSNEGKGRVRVRGFEHGATRGLELDFPGLPLPLSPTLAFHDGFLLAAATPQALVAALDWADGVSAQSSPTADWRAHFSPGQVGSLDEVQSLFFLDTPRLARQGYGLASLLGAAVANGLRSPADPAREAGQVIPPLCELLRGSRPTVMLARVRGQDLVTVGTSDRSVAAQLAAVLGWAPSVTTGFVLAGSLAALVAAPSAQENLQAAEEAKALADIWTIVGALDGHALENDGRYADSLEALLEPDEDGLSWLTELPLDPWGNPYVYESDGESVRVLSYGADGVPGGEGLDRDITSDELDASVDWEELEEDGEWIEMDELEEEEEENVAPEDDD